MYKEMTEWKNELRQYLDRGPRGGECNHTQHVSLSENGTTIETYIRCFDRHKSPEGFYRTMQVCAIFPYEGEKPVVVSSTMDLSGSLATITSSFISKIEEICEDNNLYLTFMEIVSQDLVDLLKDKGFSNDEELMSSNGFPEHSPFELWDICMSKNYE